MIRNSATLVLFAALSLTLGGCAFQGGLNTTYYQYSPRTYVSKIAGKAALQMSGSDQNEIYTGKPTSFSGASTTLSLPMGEITREAAMLAFNDVFAQGVQLVESTPEQGYVAVIQPKVTHFSYEYNQLKNAGFAITPTAVISLKVTLMDDGGKPVWEKTFESGNYEGTTYFMSGSPGDEISKTTHKAMMKVMQEAADAVHKDLGNRIQETQKGGQAL
ncbi:MAG: hypothetical protein ACLPXB_00210 [Thiobacillaceae bacterium]